MPYTINTNYSAKTQEHRIRFLILHYTQENFEKSLSILTQGKVSAHYLIPEREIDDQRMIFNLVEESQRALHAGISFWQGRNNINDTSIGVEIVSLGYKDEADKRQWFPFSDYQIESVIELAKDIISRYKIEPTCILGHADVAPGRKIDPGPLFPWKKLAQSGIGAWYDEDQVYQSGLVNKNKEINIIAVQKNLAKYGYLIEETGVLDQQTKNVVQSFQMHFRPTDYSGIPDTETCSILLNLLAKYFPQCELAEVFISSSQESNINLANNSFLKTSFESKKDTVGDTVSSFSNAI